MRIHLLGGKVKSAAVGHIRQGIVVVEVEARICSTPLTKVAICEVATRHIRILH